MQFCSSSYSFPPSINHKPFSFCFASSHTTLLKFYHHKLTLSSPCVQYPSCIQPLGSYSVNPQLYPSIPSYFLTNMSLICYYSSNLLSGSDKRNQKSQRLVKKGFMDKDHKLTTKNIFLKNTANTFPSGL